jgi:hypothetical protein
MTPVQPPVTLQTALAGAADHPLTRLVLDALLLDDAQGGGARLADTDAATVREQYLALRAGNDELRGTVALVMLAHTLGATPAHQQAFTALVEIVRVRHPRFTGHMDVDAGLAVTAGGTRDDVNSDPAHRAQRALAAFLGGTPTSHTAPRALAGPGNALALRAAARKP